MRALDKKMFRDLARIWAQALAVALVMACGIAVIIIAIGAYRSLDQTRTAFYERYRFGSVFASVVRAPRHLVRQIRDIPGVSSAQTRLVSAVLFDIDGMREPATGLAVSLPSSGAAAVNRLYTRQGRLPQSGRANEVAILEPFAKAHGLVPGDTIKAIVNGRKQTYRIVGITLSPEFIYVQGPGDLVPDPRRYGVMFMATTTLSSLLDMDGAFNSVAVTTLRGANSQRIIDSLDALLKPWGSHGAHDRDQQLSHAFLDSELIQLQAMAAVLPPIFLLVSAFLVNMVLTRLLTLEREQIGLLKAVGYSNLAISWHYAKLVVVIALVGVALGASAGLWLGRSLTQLYGAFFSFPFLIFEQSIDLYALAVAISIGAALAGAIKAIVSIVRLPPAVAMRPPAPADYRGGFIAKLSKLRWFSQLSIMAFRDVVRTPVRSMLTTLGAAMAVSLLIASLFSLDSINAMVDSIFFQTQRQDATVVFPVNRSERVIYDVQNLPGVLRSEPFRSTSIRLSNGIRNKRIALLGMPTNADLMRVLDTEMKPIRLAHPGIVLSETLAAYLDLRPGNLVELTLLEQAGRVVTVPVSAISQSYVGLIANMNLVQMNRLMRDGAQISGAHLLIDDSQIDAFYQAVKQTPMISSVALQTLSRTKFRETIEQNIGIMRWVYIVLAIIITMGVIYNSARIQLSERARELASLRVFGFTRQEVANVLLVELLIIVMLAQPLGWLLGYAFARQVTSGFESDLFRLPLVINPDTYAFASAIVLATAVVSALIVRRRVNHLDLIRVLKTRE